MFYQISSIIDWKMHIDHLDPRKLLQRRAGRQARCDAPLLHHTMIGVCVTILLAIIGTDEHV